MELDPIYSIYQVKSARDALQTIRTFDSQNEGLWNGSGSLMRDSLSQRAMSAVLPKVAESTRRSELPLVLIAGACAATAAVQKTYGTESWNSGTAAGKTIVFLRKLFRNSFYNSLSRTCPID
jgi:hypothetical protein